MCNAEESEMRDDISSESSNHNTCAAKWKDGELRLPECTGERTRNEMMRSSYCDLE